MDTKLDKIIKGLGNWIKARNKTLWEGNAGTGATLDIADIDKYESILIVCSLYGGGMLCPTETGKIKGVQSHINSTDANSVYIMFFEGTLEETRLNITSVAYSNHRISSNHGARGSLTITKIIGVEPKLEQFLLNQPTNQPTNQRYKPYKEVAICQLLIRFCSMYSMLLRLITSLKRGSQGTGSGQSGQTELVNYALQAQFNLQESSHIMRLYILALLLKQHSHSSLLKLIQFLSWQSNLKEELYGQQMLLKQKLMYNFRYADSQEVQTLELLLHPYWLKGNGNKNKLGVRLCHSQS